MKLNDLRPAPGSRRPGRRVGRGIAAGRGKTAGRGTKGQKARTGTSIPPFFEGGQTPLPQRVPKLRGFKRRWRIDYEVVNVGRLCSAVAAGRLGHLTASAPLVVTPETLAAAGLIRTAEGVPRPVKILGHGDCTVRLHVVADAFTRSAAAKIEAAGGTAQVAAVPAEDLSAIVAEDSSEVAGDLSGDAGGKAGAEGAAQAGRETTREAGQKAAPVPAAATRRARRPKDEKDEKEAKDAKDASAPLPSPGPSELGKG
jgi:large subunit ribosomal protein L15